MRGTTARVFGSGAAFLLAMLLATPCPAAKADKTVALKGKVQTIDAQPVEGVKVTLSALQTDRGAVSDAKGEFALEAPEEFLRQAVVKELAAPGGKLAPCAVLWDRPAMHVRGDKPDLLTIVFAPATARVTGVAVGDDDRPIAAAVVTLRATGKALGYSRTVVAGNDGRFDVSGLAPGAYETQPVIPPADSPYVRLQSWRPFGSAGFNVADAAAVDRKVVLKKGARLVGRALGEDGKPLVGVVVTCSQDVATETGRQYGNQQPGQWFSAKAVTDADGRYVLGGLTQETYSVGVSGPPDGELAPAGVRGITTGVTGDTAVQDVRLSRGGKLIVMVRGLDQKPVAGASVKLHGLAGEVVTGADGRATFSRLASGKHELEIAPPEGSELLAKTFSATAVAGLTTEQAVALDRGARLHGTVFDLEGKPLPGAEVFISTGNYFLGSVTCDAQGKFEARGIGAPAGSSDTAGKWKIVASPPEGVVGMKGTDVKLKDPKEQEAQEIVARLEPAAGVVKGQVTGPDGKLVANARVAYAEIKGGAATYETGQTDAQGRYAMSILQPGQFKLAVLPPQESGLVGQLQQLKRADAGSEQQVDVKLAAGAVVSGKILTPDGQGATVCQVRLQLASKSSLWFMGEGSHLSALTDAAGAFRFIGVPPGKHKLLCESILAGYSVDAPETIDVGAADAAPLALTLRRLGTIAGRILDPAGKLVARDVAYGALTRDGADLNARNSQYTLWPDETGQFELEVPAGHYRLGAKLMPLPKDKVQTLAAPDPAPVVIEEGKTVRMDVKLVGK